MAIERWRPLRSVMSPLTSWDPFQEMNRLQSEMNRLFSSALPVTGGETSALATFTPSIDVYEDEKAIHVEADVPGIDEKNLNIRLEGNSLVLEGERKEEKEEKRAGYLCSERNYGSFMRSFSLPEYADTNKIEAKFKNGVLHVQVGKKEGVKPKQIPVKTE